MACTPERSEQIAALAAGRIPADQAEDLLEHLDRCERCSQEVDAVADLVGAGERDPGLLTRSGGAPQRRIWLSLAAAAALVVTAVLWQPFGRPPALRDIASIEALPAPGDLTLRAGAEPRSAEFRAAIEAYRARDFAAAAERLAGLAQPDDALSQLYLGISLLQLGRPGEAAEALDRARSAGRGLLAERALWYLANARLLLDQPDAARVLFEELRALEGDYELNAADMLDAMRAAGR